VAASNNELMIGSRHLRITAIMILPIAPRPVADLIWREQAITLTKNWPDFPLRVKTRNRDFAPTAKLRCGTLPKVQALPRAVLFRRWLGRPHGIRFRTYHTRQVGDGCGHSIEDGAIGGSVIHFQDDTNFVLHRSPNLYVGFHAFHESGLCGRQSISAPRQSQCD
jgi:hypothetical protein